MQNVRILVRVPADTVHDPRGCTFSDILSKRSGASTRQSARLQPSLSQRQPADRFVSLRTQTCILFDLGHGRSTHHQVNHNYLGFSDGIRAVELRQRGLEQLKEYGQVRVEHHKVERLKAAEAGFRAEGQFGTTDGKAVVLCMGVLDHYPHFSGWEECVGISMFWCITCDGYESRGKKIVAAGHTNAAAGEALQMSRLSDDDLSDEARAFNEVVASREGPHRMRASDTEREGFAPRRARCRCLRTKCPSD